MNNKSEIRNPCLAGRQAKSETSSFAKASEDSPPKPWRRRTNTNDQNPNIQIKDFEPKIVSFLCNWCSYAGADLAGTSRIEYPPNIRIIRVPCSSRVNPLFVLKCLMDGVDGVLVSGCHIGDCHYSEGNFYARRRFAILKRLLEYLGIDSRRFQISWVSASEGDKWAKVVKELVEEIKQAGPNNLCSLM